MAYQETSGSPAYRSVIVRPQGSHQGHQGGTSSPTSKRAHRPRSPTSTSSRTSSSVLRSTVVPPTEGCRPLLGTRQFVTSALGTWVIQQDGTIGQHDKRGRTSTGKGEPGHPSGSATWDLLLPCEDRNFSLSTRHIAGKLITVADALSRGSLHNNEWELGQHGTSHVSSLFGRLYVDLFVSHAFRGLPRCARRLHLQTWRSDALPSPGTAWSCMFPHSPFWPNQLWFPLLLEMPVTLPLQFPASSKLLAQRKGSL